VQHTNVFPGGGLLATYDFANGGLHFHLSDPLGTRRVQVGINSAGQGTPELNFPSLPFGNDLGNPRTISSVVPLGALSAPDATEHHFTGKERDAESGNDYFEARYYASSMGRFMSPDWAAQEEPVPYANLDDPQSLNLYAYVRNNPLTRVDADGHWPTLSLPTMEEVDAFAKSAVDSATEYVVKPLVDSAEEVIVPVAEKSFSAALGVAGLFILSPAMAGDPHESEKIRQINANAASQEEKKSSQEPQTATGGAGARQGGGRNGLPADVTKLKGNQGYKDKAGNIWKKDMKHKDHWDVSDKKGKKVKEVTFDGKQLWPDGQKNKNK
jgi:RHS repeat-associated protein